MKEFFKTKLGMTIIAGILALIGTFVSAYCPPCVDTWNSITQDLPKVEQSAQ